MSAGLVVQGLSVTYHTDAGPVRAVDDVSLAVAPDFRPRPCAVTWRGKRLVKVALFE